MVRMSLRTLESDTIGYERAIVDAIMFCFQYTELIDKKLRMKTLSRALEPNGIHCSIAVN